jgi:hypothetical protein
MKKVLFVSLLWLCSCGGFSPIPTTVDASADSSVSKMDSEIQANPLDVCLAWKKLGCEEAEDTPEGVPCLTVVSNSALIPAYAARFSCIVKAKSCLEARACGTN